MALFSHVVALLIGVAVACNAETHATISSGSSCRLDATASTCTNQIDDALQSAVVREITSSLADEKIQADDLSVPNRGLDDVTKAIHDFSPAAEEKGIRAWNFLQGMANSATFLEEFWHKRPLLIRASDTGGWVERSFTVDRDLR
jgi:hypothetical protein